MTMTMTMTMRMMMMMMTNNQNNKKKNMMMMMMIMKWLERKENKWHKWWGWSRETMRIRERNDDFCETKISWEWTQPQWFNDGNADTRPNWDPMGRFFPNSWHPDPWHHCWLYGVYIPGTLQFMKIHEACSQMLVPGSASVWELQHLVSCADQRGPWGSWRGSVQIVCPIPKMTKIPLLWSQRCDSLRFHPLWNHGLYKVVPPFDS